MATDWKDALNALKDSGNLPVDNTPDPQPSEEESHIIQRTPLHVLIDKKGRKGKTATIVEGFTGPDDDLSQLAKTIKQRLGTGGSFRDGEILIQGDRKKEIMELLKTLGYKVKG